MTICKVPEERCECHVCTQIRWRLSLQGQIEMAMEASRRAAIDRAKNERRAPTE